MARVAALPMYDLPELRGATDALWGGLAGHLRAEGVTDVPAALERRGPIEGPWTDAALLFGQTCGFPLVHALDGKLQVVATPCYGAAGCGRGTYASVIVVPVAAGARTLADLRGSVAAVNDLTSHSGYNILAAEVAPLVDKEPFFRGLHITGAHVESVAAVARGDADVAAVDCVTHALLARWRPAALAGTRVLCFTESAPAPPYVTAARTAPVVVARLRAALAHTLADETLAEAREALGLTGVTDLGIADAPYRERILAIERRHLGVAISATGCQ